MKRVMRHGRLLERFAVVFLVLSMLTTLSTQGAFASTANDENSYNLYYALDSYRQFDHFSKKGFSEQVKSITFGWASIQTDENGMLKLVYDSGDFKVPLGFETVIKEARESGIQVYLNLYSDGPYDHITQSTHSLVDDIDALVSGQTIEGLSFDGVVLDMEGLSAPVQKNYAAFSYILNGALKRQKKAFFVALQPGRGALYEVLNTCTDGYILMLHDYEPKYYSLPVNSSRPVVTPLAPLDRILEDLKSELSEMGAEQAQKVILQLNMATAQWKVKGGWIVGPGGERYPYRPTYTSLVQRMAIVEREDSSGFKRFDDGSPYLHYYDRGDETWNTIWYEDEKSLQIKIDAAKALGISHFSIWRMGNLPEIGRYNLDIPEALGLIQ